MNENLQKLSTEQRNPHSLHIDEMETAGILAVINQEDKQVPDAVEAVIPQITQLVDEAHKRMMKGGRIFYIGAGTSGRLGVLDASECPPTYGVDPDLVKGLIAGGLPALLTAQEGAEDSLELAEADLKNENLTAADTVIGLAASGRTPYVIGGLFYARRIGAYTGAVSCVNGAEISRCADTAIEVMTGPEVVTGSTRMKAGTAQKLILNMISTSLMIKYGKVYQNLMVDVQPTNEKLVLRAGRIIADAAGCSPEEAAAYLKQSNYQVKIAICMAVSGLTREECETALISNQGNISKTIREMKTS